MISFTPTRSPREAVRLAKQLRPTAILMDVRLGDGPIDGVEAARQIAGAVPQVAVIMLTSYGGRTDLVRAMAAGARGYVHKAGDPDELFAAIRSGASGGMGLGREAADLMVSHVTSPAALLSDREVQVIGLLARGLSNREIAAGLHLTEATVKTHLVRIYRKLGTDTRAGTVSESLRRGLISLD